MEMQEKFIVTLDREEAEALKLLLGSFSDTGKKELQLTNEQCQQMTDLWCLLPYKEEA